MALAVPINPELVPITIGSLAPTFHTGYNWTKVTAPAINIAFWINADFKSGDNPSIPAIINNGLMFPRNIANTCWIPKGNASFKGTTPSSSYIEPFFTSSFLMFSSENKKVSHKNENQHDTIKIVGWFIVPEFTV